LYSLAAAVLIFCGTGCPAPAPSGNSDIDTDEGNASLDTATLLPLETTDEVSFSAVILGSSDVDIYSLGVLARGDRVFADVQRTSGDLDAVAIVFDERQYIHSYNDDRVPDASDLNPLIDEIIRGPEGEYFLGVAALYGSETSGEYDVTIRITRGVGVPTPPRQTVFLDWNGGAGVVIPNVGVYDLPPFDAADVGLASTQTALLKDRVQAIVAQRYTGFNLQLLNSDDNVEPAGLYSTVYFGGRNARAFAISEKIDSLNGDLGDSAIIFTSSYDGAFSHEPTLEEMGMALGNTVAHEVGHLLGLVHTSACSDLMDTTCGNDSILREQFFSTAPLDISVFPFGLQDALALLEYALGLVGT